MRVMINRTEIMDGNSVGADGLLHALKHLGGICSISTEYGGVDSVKYVESRADLTPMFSRTWAALTMPMSMPALQAWCRKALWKPRRTGSLPRKLKAMLETPPLILQPGQTRLISAVALMKSTA